jgi:antitoxin PrlF
MTLVTLTSRGQVTIPKSVRDSLLLKSGDRIEFIVTRKGEALLRPLTLSVDDVFGRLHKRGKKPFTVEEMDKGIRKKMRGES